MTFRLLLCWLLCTVLLIGCAEPAPTPTATIEVVFQATEVAVEESTEAATEEATAVPPTSTPLPEPTSTPTPEPTVQLIRAAAQTVDDSGSVRIRRIVVAEDSWLALFSNDKLLGAWDIAAGETENLDVVIDPLLVGVLIEARLYEGGEEAFSAETTPQLIQDNDPIVATFDINRAITFPSITGITQDVEEDGIVRLTSLVSPSDGWVVAYNDDGGQPGDMVGLQWIFAGQHSNIAIPLLWRQATPTLHVLLHADEGESGRFEPGIDPIVQLGDDQVSTTFTVTYPPDIAIIDQPVISNTLLIDRVISDGPGWLTIIFETEEGLPGNVIGFAPLVDGVNEMVSVEILPNAYTPILYAQVHQDIGEVGVFEFPGGDPPAIYRDEVFLFPFATDTGNYVVSADQAIDYADGKAMVNVPLAVGDVDMFVVVRTEVEGLPLGDVIGSTWVPAGISRNVLVEIDAESATPLLHVALHIDRDILKVLEYPDGRDFELQRRRAAIAAPFLVLDE